ncbi:MAG: enoyl-CoA hydratase/isomerase family protein [Myxococcota bacterium]
MGILTEIDGDIGLLLLDRPDRAHAYDRRHLTDLSIGLTDLESRCFVIVISSTGQGAFCGGADLNEMNNADPLDALDLFSQQVFNRIAQSPAIIIAAVQGPAVAGGFELALACDVRVIGPNARFLLPETRLGLIPSAGGCTRLTRLVGPARAKEVILAGFQIDARTALRWGLSERLVDEPLDQARNLAAQIATSDPVALRLAKQIIDASEDANSLRAERVAEALLYARRQTAP